MANERHMPLRRCRTAKRPGRERGSIAIIAIGAVIIICGFCSLALDLSRVYNRKMEMHAVAAPAALAAAVELNGTKAGITKAAQKASATLALPFPLGPAYSYGSEAMSWSDDAIEFGPSPSGPWVPRDQAASRNEPNGLLFAKVDTRGLDSAYGQVRTLFLPVVSGDQKIATSALSIAGPSGVAVGPFALCAMHTDARRNRSGELEEYGFRRGVSYDLMQLNPNASDSGKSFLVHPFAAPGAVGTSADDFDTVAPFVCTGTLAISRVSGGQITVSSPFPLQNLYKQLNSRFDSYTPPCNPETAPPDKNIKAYVFDNGSVSWMGAVPQGQASKILEGTNVRWTVTSPDTTPTGTTAEQYGPLWSYAKAVKYADPMPSTGYVAYGTSDWKNLYTPGKPTASSTYPTSTTPYLGTGTYSVHTETPSHPGVRDRRVLNVPLLSCPVTGSKATVKGIGRFFMTVKADSTHLYAEFAGLADEQTLRTQTKIYQ